MVIPSQRRKGFNQPRRPWRWLTRPAIHHLYDRVRIRHSGRIQEHFLPSNEHPEEQMPVRFVFVPEFAHDRLTFLSLALLGRLPFETNILLFNYLSSSVLDIGRRNDTSFFAISLIGRDWGDLLLLGSIICGRDSRAWQRGWIACHFGRLLKDLH